MELIRLAISQPLLKIEISGFDHKIIYIFAQNMLVLLGHQMHFWSRKRA